MTTNNALPSEGAEKAKDKPRPDVLLAKFKRKYPYIYGLMEEANSDLPRWVIDNMLKMSI